MNELAVETFYALNRHRGWVSYPPRCAVCKERWASGDTAIQLGKFPPRHQDCPEPESWKMRREAQKMKAEIDRFRYSYVPYEELP